MDSGPKTIFLSVFDGDTERVILRTDVWNVLLRSGHKFVLLIRGKDRIEYYRKEFGSEQVAVELLPPANSRFENAWFYIAWNTIPTRATAVRRWREYASKHKWAAYVLGGLASFLGRFRAWRNLLRVFYFLFAEDYASEIFARYKPDLLFAANMFSPEDARLLRAAKKRGIRTVTVAKSWDVLTTKAFTRVRADRILVYNEFNKREAIMYGDYAEQHVTVTGFPQFDVYFRKEGLVSREEFCRELKIQPKSRIVLYGIPGDWKSPDTRSILTFLDKEIESGGFVKPITVLARFHPKYNDSSEGLAASHIVFDKPGTYFGKEGEFSVDAGIQQSNRWTFSGSDIRHLANSLYHSDIVVNVDSTLTLDASVFDKPTILIAYDGDRVLSYKDSIAFIYEREHYQNVLKTGAVPLVHSHAEFKSVINDYLNDPLKFSKQREDLKHELLYKLDGKSGERMAQAVLEICS